MDMNINGGNNIIAPNATKIEQHIHITIILPSDLVTVIVDRINVSILPDNLYTPKTGGI